MKDKHIQIRINQCLELAKASNCPRRKFGALLLDPIRNVVLMDGYNGAPRKGGKLCGGNTCVRDKKRIKSGTQIEDGCHHAEMNVICNAAANGVKTSGAWLIVTGSCCPMCAKLIHHAGISKVIVISGKYSTESGMKYLKKYGIEIEYRDELTETINHFINNEAKEIKRLCLKKMERLKFLRLSKILVPKKLKILIKDIL